MDKGYARASTLEIATRARVSKRELYAEFGSKRGILEALITASADTMKLPLAAAEFGDRHALAASLTAYGAAALGLLSNPYVLALYRLAIAEAPATRSSAKSSTPAGASPTGARWSTSWRRGQAAGFLGAGEPDRIGREFFSLLIGDLMLWLLLGVDRTPDTAEIRASPSAPPPRCWPCTRPSRQMASCRSSAAEPRRSALSWILAGPTTGTPSRRPCGAASSRCHEIYLACSPHHPGWRKRF
jgi:AcrR family transcriptional regulator